MVQVKWLEGAGEKTGRVSRACLLAFVIVAATVMSSPIAQAQATSGSIVGEAPAGDAIVAKSTAGDRRRTKVKKNGRYALHALPLGVYTVFLMKDGEEYDTHYNVRLRPGGTARVDFPCKNDHCAKG